ncbi:MAG: hypothetical protein IPG23_00165 [Burkholderiales bacterium]|nr:hypothetical protein [Burkholderiales bacterium]
MNAVCANAHTKCWLAGKIILISGIFASEETTNIEARVVGIHYQISTSGAIAVPTTFAIVYPDHFQDQRAKNNAKP